jgi:hypothetical protein
MGWRKVEHPAIDLIMKPHAGRRFAVSNPLRRLAMKESSEAVLQQAGQAIYEVDPTLKPFDDLLEKEKEGYYLQAQAALKSFLLYLEKVVNESR